MELSEIEEKFVSLKSVGLQFVEKEFEGTKFKFRPVTAREEIKVHSELWEKKVSSIAYAHLYRIEMLSFGIREIKGIDLETEFKKILVEIKWEDGKREMIRNMLFEWSSASVAFFYRMYQVEMERIRLKSFGKLSIEDLLTEDEKEKYNELKMMEKAAAEVVEKKGEKIESVMSELADGT